MDSTFFLSTKQTPTPRQKDNSISFHFWQLTAMRSTRIVTSQSMILVHYFTRFFSNFFLVALTTRSSKWAYAVTRAMAEKTRATNRCDWGKCLCGRCCSSHLCSARQKKRGWGQGDFAHLKFCLQCEPTWLPGSLFLGDEFVSYFLRKREGI